MQVLLKSFYRICGKGQLFISCNGGPVFLGEGHGFLDMHFGEGHGFLYMYFGEGHGFLDIGFMTKYFVHIIKLN